MIDSSRIAARLRDGNNAQTSRAETTLSSILAILENFVRYRVIMLNGFAELFAESDVLKCARYEAVGEKHGIYKRDFFVPYFSAQCAINARKVRNIHKPSRTRPVERVIEVYLCAHTFMFVCVRASARVYVCMYE